MRNCSQHSASCRLSLPVAFTSIVRAALLFCAAILVSATSASAADLYVDDDDLTCGGNSPCYVTIQAAFNDASPGDTVNVRPGTYTENLALTKSLTVLGAQAGNSGCGCRVGESIVTAASGTLLTLMTGSAGSIINGLTFSGGVRGIESNTGPISNLQLLNNRVVGFTGNGIFLNDTGTDITVRQNSIDGASKVGGGGLFHLDTDVFDGFYLIGNCISNGLTGTGFFVDGVHNVGESATRDPLINGNILNNNQTGMNLGGRAFGENGVPATGVYGGSVTNNTFSNNMFDGLQGGFQHVLVSGNTFSGNGRAGLALTSFGNAGVDRGAQNSLISCNTFTGNGFTQNMSGTVGGGITYSATQAPGTIATNETHQNNFSGNFVGARYTGTETINADNNWWGSATGPTIASNPGGTGDIIADTNNVIDYTPFLTAAASCSTMTKTAGDNQGTLVNTPFPINLEVTIAGPANVEDIPVTFTAPSSGASGTFAGGCLSVTVLTNALGVATAPQFTANGQAGYYTVTATAPNHPTENFSLRNMISPTAADARVQGRIVTPDGSSIAGAIVRLAGSQTRKTITDANGFYLFDNVETNGFYTVTPALPNYSFGPASRSFSQLGNVTEAEFTGTPNAVVLGNSIDGAEYFVRQHYLDFLGREPDEAGFNFWSDQILACGADPGCVERRTINVSAAYFLSIEFQGTGGLVDGLYRASFGRAPRFGEFIPDARRVGENVVVTRSGWEQQLRMNKQAFVEDFVQRAEFRAAFDSLSNAGYVDALIGHTGVSFGANGRDALVSSLNNGSSRAEVLWQVAENEGFVEAKRNDAFVMMQYFGYLRRDPDASGYQFWLNKLKQFDGNFERAELVKAFITSDEYRARFAR